MDFLIGFICGVVVVKIYIAIVTYFLEKKLEKKIGEVLTEFRKHVINSKIEVVNGAFFMYNRETNEFLGQGNTFEELEKTMKQKYPDKLFNVPHEELKQVLKEKHENQ